MFVYSKKSNLRTGIILLAALVLCWGLLIGTARAEKPTYVFGTELAWFPWDYIDEEGDPAGIDIDIIEAIGEMYGFEVEWRLLDWDTLIPALERGRIDMTGGGMSITPERQARVDFTIPYYTTQMVVLVHEDSDHNVLTALSKGVTVANQRGTTWSSWIREQIQAGYDINQLLFADQYEAEQAVVSGKADTTITDLSAAPDVLRALPLKMIATFASEDQYGYAVQKGNEELLTMLNEGLEELKNSGRLQEIIDSYMD